MDVLNPATERDDRRACRAAAPRTSTRAVAAAKAALPEWLDTTPGERAEVLLKLADVIDANAEELARSSRGTSASRSRTRATRCRSAPTTSASSPARRALLEGKSAGEYMRGYTSMIRREPLGVVGGIAPWNYPLMMAIWKLAPGARGRQRAGAEAVRADAALAAPLRRARRRTCIPAGVLTSSPATASRSASGSSRTPTCGSSRSPATSRPARRSRAPPPTRSSASTSSSAARRR